MISILLLEGIYFYNYTSTEFNVNISQLPFWALSILFTWRCINYQKKLDFILLGFFLGIGILSKYLFLYLAISIKFFFLFLYLRSNSKKIDFVNIFLSGLIAILVILPHFIWLTKNDFITISYGFQRTGGLGNFLDHIIFPLSLIIKQATILIPFLLISFFLLKNKKFSKITINEKTIFLLFTFVLPIFLIWSTSLIMGAKIRTMWMTPFYLLLGVFFIEIFKAKINLKSLKSFYLIFCFFFFLSPIIYLTDSLTNNFKRTDYEGKEIARLVQDKWDTNFNNEIKIVIGDEWYAGNLSYHLSSRPKWFIELKETKSKLDVNEGVIYTGNPKILKKICPGVYGTIRPVGYCMIGKR